MAIFAVFLIALGNGWGNFWPISKPLWTGSYVLLTSGWSILIFAGCFELRDVRHWRGITHPFWVLGRNAIAIFIASGLLARLLIRIPVGTEGTSASTWIYQTVWASWAGPMLGSFLYAAMMLMFWVFIAFVLHYWRLYLKI